MTERKKLRFGQDLWNAGLLPNGKLSSISAGLSPAATAGIIAGIGGGIAIGVGLSRGGTTSTMR